MSPSRITGRQIVVALKGHWHAGKGICCCPAHKDSSPSLSVKETPDRILLYCFAGCEYPAVVASLRGIGLWPARDDDGYRARKSRPLAREATPELEADEVAKQKAAREIWASARAIENTAASLYLWSRGIDIKRIPPTLRYAPELYSREAKRSYPALIGAIQDGEGRVTAVQRIWVVDKLIVIGGESPAKGTKAPLKVAKKTLGPMRDGAIRLGRAARTIGIAEGIETGLSAQQRFHIPVWVSCGAWRMGNIAMPEIVERVIILGDNGAEGHKAASRAAEHFSAQGYAVDIEAPPAEHDDWNAFQTAPRPGRAA